MAQRACDCFQRSLRQHACGPAKRPPPNVSNLLARRVELLEREVTALRAAGAVAAEEREAERAAARQEAREAAEEAAALRKALGALSKVAFGELQELWAAVNGDSAAAAERHGRLDKEVAALRRSRDKTKERFASVVRHLEEADRQFDAAGARLARAEERGDRLERELVAGAAAADATSASLARRLEAVLPAAREELARATREAEAAAARQAEALRAEIKLAREEAARAAQAEGAAAREDTAAAARELAGQVEQCERAVENGALSVQQDMAVLHQSMESSARKSMEVIKGLQRVLKRQQVEAQERSLLVDRAFASVCAAMRIGNPMDPLTADIPPELVGHR